MSWLCRQLIINVRLSVLLSWQCSIESANVFPTTLLSEDYEELHLMQIKRAVSRCSGEEVKNFLFHHGGFLPSNILIVPVNYFQCTILYTISNILRRFFN